MVTTGQTSGIGVQCDTPRKPTALPDSNDGLDGKYDYLHRQTLTNLN